MSVRARPATSSFEPLEPRRLLASVSLGQNFEGVNIGASGFIPPDTYGDIGPNHYVELINGRYRVWTRAGSQVRDRSLQQFWSDMGVTPTGTAFDPRVQYDASVGRWYGMAVDNGGAANNFLFAISNTGNPLDGWVGFKIDSDADDGRWADFPQMGYDNQGIYITANMFDIAGGATLSTEVNLVVLPKSDLLLPTPSIANMTKLEDVSGTTGFSVAPVIAPGGATHLGVMVSWSTGTVNFSALSGTVTAPAVLALSDPSMSSSSQAPLGRQPDGTRTLQSSGDLRVRTPPQYVNNAYWMVGSTSSLASAAARVLQISSARSLLQSVVVADANYDILYPSLAVNSRGDAVLGATLTSATQFASSAFWIGSTTNGVTTFGAPSIPRAGLGNYSRLDGSNRNRWGDYSAVGLDPIEPSRFWSVQEFASGSNNWSTQVTEVILTPNTPSTPDLDAASDTGPANNDNYTGDNTPTFNGTAEANTTIELLVNGVPFANTTSSSTGLWSATLPTLSDGVHSIASRAVLGTSASPVSPPLLITVDTAAPFAQTGALVLQQVPPPVQVQLNESIAGSLNPGDLQLQNTTTGTTYLPTDTTQTLSPDGRTISVVFSAFAQSAPPDGHYLATLPAGAVSDLAGHPLSAPFTFSFHFLRGDMNNDGVVNNQDIAPFVQALTDPTGFQGAYGYPPTVLGDMNRDGSLDNQDIAPFVAKLTAGARPAPQAAPSMTRGAPEWSGRTPQRTAVRTPLGSSPDGSQSPLAGPSTPLVSDEVLERAAPRSR